MIVSRIHEHIMRGGTPLRVACANPHSQVEAGRNPDFLSALNAMDILLPDGVGTVVAARLLGNGGIRRFTGPDFFRTVSTFLNDNVPGCSYFFFGSTDEVLQRIVARMNSMYPNIAVAGTYAPPFASAIDLVTTANSARINSARPTILWIGMTAPKQELWMHYAHHTLNVPVIAAIGAEFDYFSGTKQRPPSIIRRAGLQWLFRLFQEPRRTWRRNFISTPLFMGRIAIEVLKTRARGCRAEQKR